MPDSENHASPTSSEIADLAARRGFNIPPSDLLQVAAAAKQLLEAAHRIEAYRISAKNRDP